jgi:uncharacterized lipoprotein YmbA
MRAYPAAALALLGFAVLTTGCLSPKDDRSQFYVLAAPVDTARTAPGDVTLGLGPITLPEYLHRPQMVTRVGENQVTISEDYRWAEDLEAGIARVMRQDLERTTGATQILIYPWLVTRKVRYAVEVDFLRFEGNAAGVVELWAAWRIRDVPTHDVLVADEFRITQQAAGPANSDVVTAQSQAVVALSRKVAAALRNIE